MSLQAVLESWGAKEVSPMEVYTDIFRLGTNTIQCEREPKGKYKSNPIVYFKNENEENGHYRILFDDTFEETLKIAQAADFAIINGITYFGRKNLMKHASKMYAMIFDLDGVTEGSLENFFSGAFNIQKYPIPNYIVLSGHGIHLYYVFEYGVSLFPNIKLQLKELKYELSNLIWNTYTSIESKKQIQGINQGFRVIGGKTKPGSPIAKSIAYRLYDHPHCLQSLNYFVSATKIDETKLFRESTMSLAEAKKMYPDWYQRIVINGEPFKKWDIAGKVHGNNPHALYDWWLQKITRYATPGHRYFAIMCLAIYAAKCDVPEDRLRADALRVQPLLNNLNPSEPFTVADVESALECYDLKYCTFPIKDIEKISGIPIPRNRRNGETQEMHLEMCRFKLKLKSKKAKKNLQGRKSFSERAREIRRWRLDNPAGTKADCIRSTGISRPTVKKWWDWEPTDFIERLAETHSKITIYNGKSKTKEQYNLDNGEKMEKNSGIKPKPKVGRPAAPDRKQAIFYVTSEEKAALKEYLAKIRAKSEPQAPFEQTLEKNGQQKLKL